MEDRNISFREIIRKLILYPVLLMVLVIIVHFILKLFNLQFRTWVYSMVKIIIATAILIDLIILFAKQSPKVRRWIGFICGVLIVMGIIFWIIPVMIFLVLASLMPDTEHVVEMDGQKYVACVHSYFLNTEVNYYDYINFIVMGAEIRKSENHKGSFDPIKSREE